MKLIFSIICFIIILKAPSVYNHLPEPEYRLDDRVIPLHYEMEIKPYLLDSNDPTKRFTFNGTTKITMRTRKSNVKDIILHANGLKFERIVLQMEASAIESPIEYGVNITHTDIETDKITVSLNRELQKFRNYILTFYYAGVMEEKQTGLYRRNYTNHESKETWIAATHFKPFHARKVFPCFDEPGFKATFLVRINRENFYSSASNMKLSRTVPLPNEDRTIDVYLTTPVMSTYLLAFLISDFQPRTTESKNLTIWSRPEAFDKIEFAYQFAPKILKYLENFTGILYKSMEKMEKLDLVAIPGFGKSVTENWGLITFQESSLYYEPDEYGLSRKETVAMTIANGIAHMWFGNLVTCDWWSYTWLNEGFAYFFQYFAINEILNEFELEKRFSTVELQLALEEDSLPMTYALSDKTVESPSDINRIFEPISYKKGSSILRMIFHLLGKEKFQSAIRNYLQQNAYQVITPRNLFKALVDNCDAEKVMFLRRILDEWTEQPGYPLVTVELNESGRSFKISQNRFRTNGTESWIIPFTFTSSFEKNFNITQPNNFIQKTILEEYELKDKADWILANIQQTGFYRVNYDNRTWNNLIKALKNDNYSGIHEINRAQIIDDGKHLVDAGLIEYTLLFKIFEYLRNEYSYCGWRSGSRALISILSKINPEDKVSFKKYILDLLKNVYNRLGFHSKSNTEKPLTASTRNIIRDLACISGHTGCIADAKKVFDYFISDPKKKPSSEMNILAYCIAVQEYGEKYFINLGKMYKADKELDYLKSLACTKSYKEMEIVINLVFHDIDPNNRGKVFLTLIRTENTNLLFDYIEKNYKQFLNSFGTKDEAVMIISHVTSLLSTQEQYNRAEKLFLSNKRYFNLNQLIRLTSALESIKEKIDFSEKHSTNFQKYIHQTDTTANSANILQITTLKLLLIFAVNIFIFYN